MVGRNIHLALFVILALQACVDAIEDMETALTGLLSNLENAVPAPLAR